MSKSLLKTRIIIGRCYLRWRNLFHKGIRFPTYPQAIQKMLCFSSDPVRHSSMALALERIRTDQIPGAIAEIGVHRGTTSELLHKQLPERMLYLFDTFAGFPGEDDTRFRNTSIAIVKARLDDIRNVEFRVGVFPETSVGLEGERFSFVLYDADKHEPAVAALAFFYPRLSPGGYFVLHDYNSPESDHAVKSAADKFLADKPERLIELPDVWGTALFRKI